MARPADHPSPEEVILGYFEDISAKRFAAARARIADDATWWVVGEGRWPLETRYPGVMPLELDDGEGRPSRWNTLRALRVLSWYSAK